MSNIDKINKAIGLAKNWAGSPLRCMGGAENAAARACEIVRDLAECEKLTPAETIREMDCVVDAAKAYVEVNQIKNSDPHDAFCTLCERLEELDPKWHEETIGDAPSEQPKPYEKAKARFIERHTTWHAGQRPLGLEKHPLTELREWIHDGGAEVSDRAGNRYDDAGLVIDKIDEMRADLEGDDAL